MLGSRTARLARHASLATPPYTPRAHPACGDEQFPTKAIAIWGQTDDAGHIWIVGAYYKFSAEWADVKAVDVTTKPITGDPMFVVQGTK